MNESIIDEYEARFSFGSGYAGKRNTVLYTAIKNNMDYLIFLDDDEYPMAVTNTRSTAIWHVLSTHLQYIKQADITNKWTSWGYSELAWYYLTVGESSSVFL